MTRGGPNATVRERSAAPRILVTDARLGSAISIIRSLGRRGWYVLAADSDPRSPGFYSRYARERVRYPPPLLAPDAVVDTLLQVVAERNVDLIVPVTDEIILPLSAGRDRFAGRCSLALPDASALAICTSKAATLELACRLGVPAPRSCLVKTTEEARQHAGSFGWPIVLKPESAKLYRTGRPVEALTVAYAENEEQLARRFERFEGRCDVLMQEYWPGEGHGVGLLLHRGRPLAAFQHRRLRETPLSGGASSFRESVPLDPALYDYAVRLLRALDWTGPAMVEFKVGPHGPRLMEINGRIWGSLPLATRSGVDFPRGWMELCLFGPPRGDVAPQTTYAVGLRSRNLELELVWIKSVLSGDRRYRFEHMPSRRHALAVALRLLNPADGYDVLSRDDPLPGVAEVLRIARKALGTVRHRPVALCT